VRGLVRVHWDPFCACARAPQPGLPGIHHTPSAGDSSSRWPLHHGAGAWLGRARHWARATGYASYGRVNGRVGDAFTFDHVAALVERANAAVVWCRAFGPALAAGLRRRRRAGGKWHLDEVQVKIKGKRHWLWRAVDQDGTMLDILVQERRNQEAAETFLRRVLDGQG